MRSPINISKHLNPKYPVPLPALKSKYSKINGTKTNPDISQNNKYPISYPNIHTISYKIPIQTRWNNGVEHIQYTSMEPRKTKLETIEKYQNKLRLPKYTKVTKHVG